MTCASGSPSRQLNSTTLGVPSGADHEPGVEHPAEGSPATGELLEVGREDLLQRAPEQRRRRDGDRAVRTHAAGVGSLVSLAQPLVILRRGQELDCVAVGDREQRELLSFEKFLDDDHAAGLAECDLSEHRRDGAARLRAGCADDGALASREAGGLHDERLGVLRTYSKRRRPDRSNVSARRRGNARAAITSLANAFDASIARRPRPGRRRADPPRAGGRRGPARAGTSGPMTVRSMPYMSAASAMRSMSVGGDGEIGGEFSGAGVSRARNRCRRPGCRGEAPSKVRVRALHRRRQVLSLLLRFPERVSYPIGRALGGVDHVIATFPGLPQRSDCPPRRGRPRAAAARSRRRGGCTRRAGCARTRRMRSRLQLAGAHGVHRMREGQGLEHLVDRHRAPRSLGVLVAPGQ